MPDLNTVPPSPHSLATSRRASTNQMPPPPVPTSPYLHILPSNQAAVANGPTNPAPPAASSPTAPTTAPSFTEHLIGPGPLRHPRPLTVADLHLQLEKEQEAVVNRLTRELSILRAAQNASVVSNTSSTSASASGADANHDPNLLSGAGFSIPSSGRRHHRSPSNTSTRSQTAMLVSSSLPSVEARRPPNPVPLSRQNSLTQRSQTSSPAPPHHPGGDNSLHYVQQQRFPVPASSSTSTPATPFAGPASLATSDQLSPGLVPATSRYEEALFYRGELDSAKRENEMLRRRIRELERMLRDRRASDASRPRSESVSTTASISVSAAGGGAGIAGPRDGARERPTERDRGMTAASVAGSVGIGVPDEEVKVGESAASAGLRSREHT